MSDENRDLDAGARRSRRRVLGVISYLLGCVLAVATVVYGVAMFAMDGNVVLRALAAVGLLLCALGLLVAAEAFFVPSVRDVLARDRRPPVLYLRPFGEDKPLVYDVISSGETVTVNSAKAEDFLLALNAIGPLVSIAEPDWAARIGMHPHGAYRDFVGGGDWQARVRQLLDGAGMVVLAVGDSPGIEWEIEQVRRRVGPEDLLLYLPPRPASALTKKGRARREQAVYEQFAPLVERHFGVRMPPFSAATYIIGFTADGGPVLPGDTPPTWSASEQGRVAKAIRAQLDAVLARVRPGTELRGHRRLGRAAAWVRGGVAVALALATLGVMLSAWDGRRSGIGDVAVYGQAAVHALPGTLLTVGWVLLARYFRRAWVWLVPAAVGVATAMNALFTLLLVDHPQLIDAYALDHWYVIVGWFVAMLAAVTVLVLGIAMLQRPPPGATRH
ncbi:MAG: hypothetical protein QNJ91_01615 [Gammaproteobacteria bacterium]|nr:hypothetical protein [Gammaproteobacteria bacterium]